METAEDIVDMKEAMGLLDTLGVAINNHNSATILYVMTFLIADVMVRGDPDKKMPRGMALEGIYGLIASAMKTHDARLSAGKSQPSPMDESKAEEVPLSPFRTAH